MILNLHNLVLFTFLTTYSYLIYPTSASVDCPHFWTALESWDVCYIVLSPSWPESADTALDYCESYSDGDRTGSLLELGDGLSLDELRLPVVDSSYWVSPRRFQDNFYNVLTGTPINQSDLEPGLGDCLILNHFVSEESTEGNKLFPTDCGLYKRPFICALYSPDEHEENTVNFKRHQEKSVSGSQCDQLENVDSDEKCSARKLNGKCSDFGDICAKSCCGVVDSREQKEHARAHQGSRKQAPEVNYEIREECRSLDDLESAKTCFDRAFRHKMCHSDYLRDPCALACCEAEFFFGDDDEEIEARSLVEIDLREGEEPAGSTEHPCYEFFGMDEDGCVKKILTSANRCNSPTWQQRCPFSCCVTNPPPCIQERDVLDSVSCMAEAASGNCRTPSVYSKCGRTCCEEVGGSASSTTTVDPVTPTETETVTGTVTETATGTVTETAVTDPVENTTMNETTTTESSTTSPTTEFMVCKEYYDRASDAKCEKRVNNSNCQLPLSEETRCQYSCCLAMFEVTTTEAPTTTEVVTTPAPADLGLAECEGLTDVGQSPHVTMYLCAAMIIGDGCSKSHLRQLCEFTCCMNEYSHDEDNHENNDPAPLDCCEEEPEDLYDCPTCVEVYILGRCDEFQGCETTCCLWKDSFFGTQCLAYVDISGYEFCTLNCMFVCDEVSSMCKHNCARTTCLYCDSPYDWPPTTDTPSECLELTNEDSGVDCGAVVLNDECDNPVNDGSGVYDDECNFACCAAAAQMFPIVKRSGDVIIHKRVGEVGSVNTTSISPESSNTTSFFFETDASLENSDKNVTSRQSRNAGFEVDYDYSGDMPCMNPLTLQNDPDCVYQQRMAVRHKRALSAQGLSVLVADREMQLEPSVLFTAVILILMKICWY